MSLFVYDDLVFLLDSKGKETKCPVWFTAESDLIISTVPSSCALPPLNKNVQSLKWRSPSPASRCETATRCTERRRAWAGDVAA